MVVENPLNLDLADMINLKAAILLFDSGQLKDALESIMSNIDHIGRHPLFMEFLIALSDASNDPEFVLERLIRDFESDPEHQQLTDVVIEFAAAKSLLPDLCERVMKLFSVYPEATLEALKRIGETNTLPYALDKFCLLADAAAKGDEFLDYRDELAAISGRREDKPDCDTVCLLSFTNFVRTSKLAHGLRLAGKKVILITPAMNPSDAWAAKYFDEILEFSNYVELFGHIGSVNPAIFHVTVNPESGYYGVFCLMSLGLQNIVIDPYDPLDPSTIDIEAVQISAELRKLFRINQKFLRFITNHASGICTRSRFKIANRSLLKNWRGKLIYFPEACWNEPTEILKESAADGKIHVVYGGSMFSEKTFDSKWCGVLWLGREAEALDIHVHLYGMPWGSDDMQDYYDLAENSANFHMHDPLPYEAYLNEVKKYDVGIHITYPRDEDREPNLPGYQFSGIWTNRVADFMDGDVYYLPYVRSRAMVHAAEHYRVGERFTVEQGLSREFWDRLKEKLLIRKEVDFASAVNQFSIRKQGSRLVRFYNDVLAAPTD